MSEDWTCRQCGECCKDLAFVLSPQAPMLELLEVHYGRPIKKVKFRIEHRCMHLSEDNSCDIYEDRPKICRKFECNGNKSDMLKFTVVDS